MLNPTSKPPSCLEFFWEMGSLNNFNGGFQFPTSLMAKLNYGKQIFQRIEVSKNRKENLTAENARVAEPERSPPMEITTLGQNYVKVSRVICSII